MTALHGTTLLMLGLLAPIAATAQESQFRSDLRREASNISDSCDELSAKATSGCAITVATADPFHLAVGSLAPQNGMGVGLAFVEHTTPNERWRLSWNADVVATPSGSWRAGAYLKIIRTPDTPGVGVRLPGSQPGAGSVTIREYPVFDVYAQTISLDNVLFFGTGPSSTEAGKSVFRERQTIVGGTAIVPIATTTLRGLRPSFVGGINGRWIRIGGNAVESSPSINQLYDEQSAPGVVQQPAFLQLEEGVRLKPAPFSGALRMNYLVDFQQFVAGADAHASFRRWTIDLKHEIPLYRSVSSPGPRESNGPDECFESVGSTRCPPLSTSRNREGAVGFRVLTTSSSTPSGSAVPFYFLPTLGGSDINGERLLSAYDDYRFRGPHLLVFQEGLEHSIWGPVGFWLQADQGKVAERRADLDFRNLAHSFEVGLTVRAGGFPVINLSYAWGGERHHAIATINASLLGGSARPSLY